MWETDREIVTLKRMALATNKDLANELAIPPGSIGQYVNGYVGWPEGVREKAVRFLRARAERSVQGCAAPAPTPTTPAQTSATPPTDAEAAQ